MREVEVEGVYPRRLSDPGRPDDKDVLLFEVVQFFRDFVNLALTEARVQWSMMVEIAASKSENGSREPSFYINRHPRRI